MAFHTQPAPPGEMVDIGGFRLHALLQGQGSPTVILEPALGGFALQYAKIQAGIAAFTRVLAYDRAGQGWSDVSPNLRQPAFLAGELKLLLGRLGLQPPYILVGHSFGGLLVRCYAGFYPKEAAGMVLVDASHEYLYASFPDMDRMVRQAGMGVRLIKMVSQVGLGKPLTRLSLGSAAKTLPKADLDAFVTVMSQPKHQEAMLAEYTQYRCFYGPQAEVPRTLGELPLVVVTAGSSVSAQKRIGSLTGRQMNFVHLELQKKLVELSTQGEQVLIPGATHLSILLQPEYVEQVVAVVRGLVERVRRPLPAVGPLLSGQTT